MVLGAFGETESAARQQDRLSLQMRAVALLADGMLTEEEIAQQLGIHLTTLWRWKKSSNFRQRLERAREIVDSAASRYVIAQKRNRVKRVNQDWEDLQRIKQRRAEEYVAAQRTNPDPTPIPGGETGLLKPGTTEIDRGLLADLLELEKRAAIEVHQWDDGAKAPLQINITLRNEAERLATKLGIPVEELYIEAEALLLEASNDAR